ncbi:hypothetical protein H5P28_01055 [Ruficoccus amylovorans]|uniref:Uncharacterized protein n=1 Tax=Ruficoccus amylovorans TaxID=1804625 RepID=A0A842HB26_9BACT|nr:hypothetical protein [Ruficoccus amylovorans]MBC2592837.1 hypothetical protein [Ruficoccus amylovorans]
MTDIAHRSLKKLFLDCACRCENTTYLTVKELDKNATLKRINIHGVSDSSLIFRFDCAKQLIPCLNGGDHQKNCDAVIATVYKGRNILLFVELKSSTQKNGHIKKQFKSTDCFINYISEILDTFFSCSIKGWERHYVAICGQKGAQKLPTRYKRQQSSPTNPTYIINPKTDESLDRLIA